MDALKNDVTIIKKKTGTQISLNGIPLNGILSYNVTSDSSNGAEIAILNLSIGLFGEVNIKYEE